MGISIEIVSFFYMIFINNIGMTYEYIVGISFFFTYLYKCQNGCLAKVTLNENQVVELWTMILFFNEN